MKGLIVKAPWIQKILSGEKTWEIRGRNTKIRGTISLIQSGTGTVLGTVNLVDCMQLTEEEYQKSYLHHCIKDTNTFPYKKVYAWVLKDPVLFDKPVSYTHPQGAVIWVNLD